MVLNLENSIKVVGKNYQFHLYQIHSSKKESNKRFVKILH